MITKQSLRHLPVQIFFSILLVVTVNAQPAEQWVKAYNSPININEYARYITVDNSGNVIVTGISGNNIVTIKYSPAGTELWVRIHNSGIICDINGIAADNNGNIIITGSDAVVTNRDMLTIKYDTAGNILWERRYNGTGNRVDVSRAITLDAGNNIFITGYNEKNTAGTYEMVTIKYNSAGAIQWENKTDAVFPNANVMKLDASGNIYICGELIAANTNAFVAKISSAGTLQFIQTYDFTPAFGVDVFTSLEINGSGTNFYVTGRSLGGGTEKTDFVTVKYNAAGSSEWVQRFNGPGNGDDFAYSLVIDNAENIYSTGQSNGEKSASGDIAIVKYSSAGAQLGSQIFSVGSNNEGAYKVRIDANQDLYLAGFSNSDALILKYNSALALQWSKTFNSPANQNDVAYDMILDNTGNIYVTGTSEGISSKIDYMTIKYSQLVGINQIPSESPTRYLLSQNFPNPFNPSTNIRFDIPNDALVNITVYDITGREVMLLVDGYEAAGSYELNFDASGLSSGMYFYKFTAGSFTDIKKMVLLK